MVKVVGLLQEVHMSLISHMGTKGNVSVFYWGLSSSLFYISMVYYYKEGSVEAIIYFYIICS